MPVSGAAFGDHRPRPQTNLIPAMLPQLPLQLSFPEAPRFDQFHAGSNREVIQSLKNCTAGTGEPYLYLWGGRGCGKTHLLHACCREAHSKGQAVGYLPMTELRGHGPDILQGLEQMMLLCIDDIHAVAGNRRWEEALFHGFNRWRESSIRLIISADQPPAELPIALPDLKTRLTWGLTLRLQPFNDDDKLAALQLRAKQLGLELSPQVGKFLLTHSPRDLPSLWRLLNSLDQATLAAKRKLTIPFLKAYLESES